MLRQSANTVYIDMLFYMKVFLTFCCCLPMVIQGILFQKKLLLTDPAYCSLFTPTIASNNLKSIIECGGFANIAINNQDKSKRASAFYYNGTTCQLGRTPIFLDALANRTTIIDGTPGIHVALDIKPLAYVAIPDMWAFLVINELQRFDDDPNLGKHDSTLYDGVDLTYEFTMLSPVQTFEGQYAGGGGSNAYLQYTITPKVFTAVTVLLWHNHGPAYSTFQPLFTIADSTNWFNGFSLWSEQYNNGDLFFSVYNPNWQPMATTGHAFPLDAWVYLGASFDGVNGIMTTYVNGSISKSNPNIPKTPLTPLDTIQIGYRANPSPHILTSYLASVEVYERYMTASEVLQMMERSTATRVNV